MSDNIINAALKRLGVDTKGITAHGFRVIARTVLEEVHGIRSEVIELQLAHAVRVSTRQLVRTDHRGRGTHVK